MHWHKEIIFSAKSISVRLLIVWKHFNNKAYYIIYYNNDFVLILKLGFRKPLRETN